MIKYSYEHDNQELKVWIDNETGSLWVQTRVEKIEVPHTIANELLAMMRTKLFEFEDKNKKWWKL